MKSEAFCFAFFVETEPAKMQYKVEFARILKNAGIKIGALFQNAIICALIYSRACDRINL